MCQNPECSILRRDVLHRVSTDPEKYAHLIARDEGDSTTSATGRRRFLGAAAGLAGVAGAGLLGAGTMQPAVASAPGPAPSTGSAGTDFSRGLHIALLGTKAGPPLAADRAGISTALVVDGRVYLVDCGRASVTQFHKAGLTFGALQGIFLTHLHADHVADYFNYFMMASTTGKKGGDVIPKAVPVYGPGPAGGLPDAWNGQPVPTAGEDPTPGTKAMTDHLLDAFAYTNNIFMRDAGFRDYRSLMEVHEIMPPASVHATYLNRAPRMKPFTVMEDSHVKVTATLVPHGPVFPAYAFRFDTNHGAVTFSGDTTHTKNLIQLAKHSDVLIHEALQIPPDAGLTSDVIDHHMKSHVMVEDVGPIAQKAHAKHLVLSHIEDTSGTIDMQQWHTLASRGYDGEVTVGQDLQVITVAP